jgi:hypothetical protein
MEPAVEMQLGSREALGGQEAILEDRETREQVCDLVGSPESEGRPAVRREPRDVVPEERDPPPGRRQLAADEAEQRGLPRSVGPDDGAALPRPDLQADAVHGAKTAEGPRHRGQRQRGV